LSLLVTEIAIVSIGFALVGRAVIDRQLVRRTGLTALASVAAWAAAEATASLGWPVSLLAGSTTVALYLLVTRRGAWGRGYGTTLRAFLPSGLLFGLSYTALFQAYYRGRVSVVAPLVATESLWGVAFSALLLRRTELVGRRLVAGAVLIVAGGVLIGATR
jgi:uncharacterized membrane protein